ncbi:uncharacterized protein Z520_10950 [Fonsecaea multimorphosa CBS 102226]|uniref:Uncharacterized protein n=1 Tax=Fonsecaea multimorphosa CBS 102226 TaxID=1442371 RepID=A0A0D2JJD4_9EURO|nr:uncharacterized protein Z520_10950 [Fonsecaea multimorphosa CBS 102226]KIX93307.1 hypothetical protein Z520_10950 [Fonsecaea multimorphosa CBS 102226]OAL18544.1 hypothetical protein AYO22_10521 [Fonsecaea multimorphosa]
MCTTKRYLFLCCHPATHRFRNTLCDSPSVRGCQVRDFNIILGHPCKKCSDHGLASMHMDLGAEQESGADDVWYIPTRCFVDAGFRTLDPFKKAETSEPSTPTSQSTRHSVDEDPLTPPLTPTKIKASDPNFCRRLLRRLTLKKLSPCCTLETQYGGYEATRIEGLDNRVDGVIRDSFCESQF